MKIILAKTKASSERREELQSKIFSLLDEYEDVPILVANQIIFQEGLDFISDGEPQNIVHIINRCIFDTTQQSNASAELAMPQPPEKEPCEWEWDIDNKIGCCGGDYCTRDHNEELKSFISSLLQNQAQEIEEKVRTAYRKGYMDASQSIADEMD